MARHRRSGKCSRHVTTRLHRAAIMYHDPCYSTFADMAVLTDMSGMKTVAAMRNVMMGVLILAERA